MTLGHADVQFVFLNKDASCHVCGHGGHNLEHCPLEVGVKLALLSLLGTSKPTAVKTTKKKKEKEVDRNSSESSDD
mgnify:FL=1